MLNDLRIAARSLARRPGFALLAGLMLALGIGANTAIFSVVHAVLLRPLPYADPQRLVRVEPRHLGARGVMEISHPELLDWRRESSQLADIAAHATGGGGSVVEIDGSAERVAVRLVTWNLFRLLGVPPLTGRGFEPADDVVGAAPVALLSEGCWRTRFAGDPHILGKRIEVRGTATTIVGVLPAGVEYPVGAQLWITIAANVPAQLVGDASVGFLNAIGRLAEGATIASARAELDGILGRLAGAGGPASEPTRASLVPLRDDLLSEARGPLLILLAAAGIVLLTACANVANLQIVRGIARRRELAIRAALGAGAARQARLALAEGSLLAAAGAVGGIALGHALLRALLAASPVTLFRGQTIALDAPVLAFAAALAAATAVASALAPGAGARRTPLAEALQAGTRATAGASSSRVVAGFAVAQLALAVALLVGAGLLLQSLLRLQSVDTGFSREQALMLSLPLLGDAYAEPAAADRFFAQLCQRLEARPEVTAAAGALSRPLETRAGFDYPFTIEGRPPDEQSGYPFLNYLAVTPSYFDATGIRRFSGRAFTSADAAEAPGVVLVSRAVADRFWKGQDPLGQRLKWGGPEAETPWLEVVGVVASARYRGIEQVSLDVYVPFEQSPWKLSALVVRGSGDPQALLAGVRQEIRRLDPGLHALDATTGAGLISRATVGPRFNAALLLLFGALALLIGAVGLYGVQSHAVAIRTREIGVRMALGATRRDILSLALGRGLQLAALGVSLGIALAAALARVSQGMLFGIDATDAMTLATVPVLLLLVALAASLVPALRASRLDPLRVLRAE